MSFLTPKKLLFSLIFALYWYFFLTVTPNPPLIVSPETTYFTRPLDKNGYVNYVAAINMQHKNLLPGQNAVIPLLSIVGKDCWPPKSELASITSIIGEPLPKPMSAKFILYPEYMAQVNGNVLVDRNKTHVSKIASHVQSLNPEGKRPEIDNDGNGNGNVVGHHKHIVKFYNKIRPWNRKDFPSISNWILANSKAIEAFKKAALCKGLFCPLIYKKEYQYASPLTNPLKLFRDCRIRSLANCMQTQAMGMIYDGDIKGAIANLEAIARVGLLIADSNEVLDTSVGNLILNRLVLSMLSLVDSKAFSIEVGKQLLKMLATLAPVPDGSKALKYQCIISPIAMLFDHFRGKAIKNHHPSELDINVAARMTISHGQLVCKFLEKNTLFERLKKMKEVRNKLAIKNKRMSSFDMFIKTFKIKFLTHRWAKRAALTKFLTEILLHGEEPNYEFYKSTSSTQEVVSLVRIAIKLRMFKLKNGSYPKLLSEIKSSFLKTSLIDPYTNKELKYRREGNGCVFYSLGENQIDDGGKNSIFTNDNKDLVIRLKD